MNTKTTTWRAFAGQWSNGSPEWAYLDARFLDWEEARRALLAELEPFKEDTCDDCRRDGLEVLSRLATTAAGVEFSDEVDGADYLIVAE